MNKAYGSEDQETEHDCARMLVYVQTMVPNLTTGGDIYDVMQDALNCPRLWCGQQSRVVATNTTGAGGTGGNGKTDLAGQDNEDSAFVVSVARSGATSGVAGVFGSQGLLSGLLPERLPTREDLLSVVSLAEVVPGEGVASDGEPVALRPRIAEVC